MIFTIIFCGAWTMVLPAWRPRSRWPGWLQRMALLTLCVRRMRMAGTPMSQRSIAGEDSASCSDCSMRESIPLTLGSGCDFHLSYENIQEAKAESGAIQHQRAGLSAGGDSRLWPAARVDRDLLPAAAGGTDADSDASGAQSYAAGRSGTHHGLAAAVEC